MASVTSLDKDMRKLRLDRYTPQAANEVRTWVESILGETLKSGDLLDALKDGVALCKLANLALPPPGIRFKPSAMPFVQMENISHFLRACQSPPLNLQPHDVFLTVDLFESKDPAQVLQCMSAFSRVANKLDPSKFPSAIGPTSRGAVSPQRTGTGPVGGGSYGNRARGASNASSTSNPRNSRSMTPTRTGESASGRLSPTKSMPLSPGVSSWSRKQDEGSTSPAWNIAQYGYMGGASQGNMGVSFGGRRQITSAGPHVPSLAEKDKKRREAEEEAVRLKQQMEEAEHIRKVEREAEEERAKVQEEEKWAAETQRLRKQEREKAEEEKRRWEAEEKRWQQEEEQRLQEERNAEAKLVQDRNRARGNSDPRLQGQFLSQYQEEQGISNGNGKMSRIEELEKELEKARAREAQYERERQERKSREHQAIHAHDMSSRIMEEIKPRPRSRSRTQNERQKSGEDWRETERKYLRDQLQKHQEGEPAPPLQSPRPLPEPTLPVRVKTNHTGPSSRPLPDPAAYTSPQPPKNALSSPAPQLPNRTDRFLSSNPAPQEQMTRSTYSSELGAFDSNAERDEEDRRRKMSQQKTKAGGWASKSLLEREMELERQRQQEWEESQKATAARSRPEDGVNGIGGGIGGSHDISQWSSYTRGDNQNKGGQGIGSGRRQIVGPRPPPGR